MARKRPTMSIEGEPLYECGECGRKFLGEDSAQGSGNQCPDCNRMAAKVSDFGIKCPECDEAFELGGA